MKFRNIAALLYSTPWLIVPERLEVFDSVFQDRRNDIEVSDAELQFVLASNRPVHQSRLAGLLDSAEEENQKRYHVQDGIGVLYASGVLVDKANMMSKVSGMTSYQQLGADFLELLQRDDVSRIVMDGDSPGGISTGCTDLARLIFQSRGRKPLDFYVSGQCCSGMYYIASAFDRIVAGPSTTVGSLGAYTIMRDTSKAQENAGVKIEIIRSVDLKGRGLGEPLTDAARSSFQTYVMDVHNRFIGDVARFRGVSVEQVNERYGNGASLDVERAFSAGMVDRIATWNEFWASIVGAPQVVRQGAQSPGRTVMKITERMKALLLMQGLIATMAADDASVEASLRSFCKGLGVQITAELEGDETKLLSAIETAIASRHRPVQLAAAPLVPQLAGAAAVSQGPSLSADEQTIVQRATVAANLRAIDIRNRAADLNATVAGVTISDAEIDAAITSGRDPSAIVGDWFRSRAPQNRPATPVANNNGPRGSDGAVTAGREGFERFIADAAPAMRQRLGDRADIQLSQGARDRDMHRWRLGDFARADLEARGIRVDRYIAQGDLMREWFASQCSGAGEIMIAEAGSGATGGVGRMPTLLGSVMGMIHLQPIQNEDITFPRWCNQLEDLSDFNPKTILTVLYAGRLDDNMNGADPKKFETDEEATWIKAVFANKSLEFTFIEQENNNFDRLRDIAEQGRFMCDDKMEEKAVNLLTSTISINGPDGSVAVSTARGNLIDTGDSAAPSVDQFEKMQMALRAQVDKKGNNAGSGLGMVLHPYQHEILLKKLLPKQVFMANGVFTPSTVSNVNPFAEGEDSVERIYVPRLDKTGKKYYYGLSRKRRAISYAYKSGFGQGGKRRIVFNPRNGNVEFIYEQAGAVVLTVSQYITINKSGEA